MDKPEDFKEGDGEREEFELTIKVPRELKDKTFFYVIKGLFNMIRCEFNVNNDPIANIIYNLLKQNPGIVELNDISFPNPSYDVDEENFDDFIKWWTPEQVSEIVKNCKDCYGKYSHFKK